MLNQIDTNSDAQSHDNAPTIQNQNSFALVNDLVAANHSVLNLNDIVAERKTWEVGAYRTSNQQLYSVLAKCLSYYEQLSSCKSAKDELRIQFDSFVALNDIKFKSGTSTINKVVKCVFYDQSLDSNAQRDRRRISAYSTVLTRAIRDEIKSEQLAAFIDTNGGIEQIRLNKSNKISTSVKAQLVRRAIESTANYLAVINDHALMHEFDATDYDKAFVVVVVPRGDGKLELRQVIKNESAINSGLATLYKQTVEDKSLNAIAA